MANTLTGLIPILYEAVDVVSRELVGFIPAVSADFGMERAAVGQTVTSFVAPAATASDLTPGVSAPNDGDQTIGTITMTMQKARGVPVRWNGEEELSVRSGVGRANIIRDQFAQAMRTLTNEVEADLADAAYKSASRAYGTAGTAPFASSVADSALVRKIMDDNGAPPTDRSLIFDTSAGANLRSLANVTRASESGGTEYLRQGTLLDMHGFAFRESAQIKSTTKGTGASYTTNTAGYAIGATAITLITGSGTILAGDVITFAGDTNKYVVTTALTGGIVTIAKPGLRQAIAASAVAVTVGNTAARNVAFSRNALSLATRAPALPTEGDMATDATFVTDPVSGLSFEVRLYKQYRQVRYEVALAWGVKASKEEHIAMLLG